MSNDKQRGRADAAKGAYRPPSEPFFGLFSSTREVKKTAERKAHYDEGYHDKKREMGRRK